MASTRWTYDLRQHRYRDEETGRFLSETTVRGLRDDFLGAQKQRLRELVERYFDLDDFDLDDWVRQSRGVIKDLHGAEYVFGRGGQNVMGARDWGIVGRTVRSQYQFFQGFAEAVRDGTLSRAQAGARAELYGEAGSASMERGRTEARGMPVLDQYPGDGQTLCGTNCACALDIREVDGGWEVAWELGAADHCGDCEDLAQRWNPLFISAEGEPA